MLLGRLTVNIGNALGTGLLLLLGAVLVAAVGGFWLLFAASAVVSVLGAALYAAVREAQGTGLDKVEVLPS